MLCYVQMQVVEWVLAGVRTEWQSPSFQAGLSTPAAFVDQYMSLTIAAGIPEVHAFSCQVSVGHCICAVRLAEVYSSTSSVLLKLYMSLTIAAGITEVQPSTSPVSLDSDCISVVGWPEECSSNSSVLLKQCMSLTIAAGIPEVHAFTAQLFFQ